MKLTYAIFPALIMLSQAAVSDTAGSINFTGKVTNNTCEIETTGGVISVALPVVPASSLATANSTAGEKTFKINFVNCDSGSVAAAFPLSVNGSNLDGDHIKNTAATDDAAKNVAIALYEADAITKIKLGEAGASSSFVDIPALEENEKGSGSVTMVAKYISTTGSAEAGEVSGNLNYQVEYK